MLWKRKKSLLVKTVYQAEKFDNSDELLLIMCQFFYARSFQNWIALPIFFEVTSTRPPSRNFEGAALYQLETIPRNLGQLSFCLLFVNSFSSLLSICSVNVNIHLV